MRRKRANAAPRPLPPVRLASLSFYTVYAKICALFLTRPSNIRSSQSGYDRQRGPYRLALPWSALMRLAVDGQSAVARGHLQKGHLQ